ncbi:MAG: VanZ family protein [Flavobacteriaceae bacterium]
MKWPIKRLLEAKFIAGLAITYSFIVTLLMVLPVSAGTPIQIPFFDKFLHIMVYLLWTFIWLSYVKLSNSKAQKRYVVIPILLFIYGIIIEVIQGKFIANRSHDFWDVMANGMGILIGLLVFYKTKDTFIFKN